jgi:dihydroneopterin aldolase
MSATAPVRLTTGLPVDDRIALIGLRGHGHHGVLAAERLDGQEFVVDLVLHLDTRVAAATDDLTDTVSYATLARAVMDVIVGEPVALVETLAQRVADVGLADRRVDAVDVTIHKPAAPVPVPFADVTVTIRRHRQ